MSDKSDARLDRRGVSEDEVEKIANAVWWDNLKRFSLFTGIIFGFFATACTVLLMWGLNSSSKVSDQRFDYIIKTQDDISVSLKTILPIVADVERLQADVKDQKKTFSLMDERLKHLEMVVK